MKTYCTAAELAELQPDLDDAMLFIDPDNSRSGVHDLTLKSLLQRAVNAMALPEGRHIEIQLPPPPKHSGHYLNAEQILQLAQRFGVEAKEP